MASHIRRLVPEDAPRLVELRMEALRNAPFAFGSSPEDDHRGSSVEVMRASLADTGNQAIFGSFQGEELTGMVGLVRNGKTKERHKTQVWGMYVTPGDRNGGTGRMLIEAVIAQAYAWEGVSQIHLSVTSAASSALRLYQRSGFRLWGVQPRSIQHNGEFVDESHMILERV